MLFPIEIWIIIKQYNRTYYMWSRINEMECKLLQYPVGQRFKYCRIHFFCLGYCCVYINHNSDDNSQ